MKRKTLGQSGQARRQDERRAYREDNYLVGAVVGMIATGPLIVRIQGLLPNIGPEWVKYWNFQIELIRKNMTNLDVLEAKVRKWERTNRAIKALNSPGPESKFKFDDWLAAYHRAIAFKLAKRPEWMNDPSKLPKAPPGRKPCAD